MTILSSIVKTILLGIIQGITEWLPISSTGHLIVFASIWPLEPADFFEVFKVVIQFGSILAVLVLYYQKLNPFDKRKSLKKRKQTLQLWSKVNWHLRRDSLCLNAGCIRGSSLTLNETSLSGD